MFSSEFHIDSDSYWKMCLKRNSPVTDGDGIGWLVVGVVLDLVGEGCEDIVGNSIGTKVNKRLALSQSFLQWCLLLSSKLLLFVWLQQNSIVMYSVSFETILSYQEHGYYCPTRSVVTTIKLVHAGNVVGACLTFIVTQVTNNKSGLIII